MTPQRILFLRIAPTNYLIACLLLWVAFSHISYVVALLIVAVGRVVARFQTVIFVCDPIITDTVWTTGNIYVF